MARHNSTFLVETDSNLNLSKRFLQKINFKGLKQLLKSFRDKFQDLKLSQSPPINRQERQAVKDLFL